MNNIFSESENRTVVYPTIKVDKVSIGKDEVHKHQLNKQKGSGR